MASGRVVVNTPIIDALPFFVMVFAPLNSESII